MVNASVLARLRTWALVVWHFVRSAPMTYTWLLMLTVTTIVQNQLTGRQLHAVLLHRSTNIGDLATDPLGVLFSSLLWVDGKNLESYLLVFTLFLAPAERWLGHLRWLTVGLTTHVLATYVGEGLLYLAIQHHDAAERFVRAHEIGVSYFLTGVMAVLTYHIAKPWRWGYLAVLFIIFGFPLVTMDRIDLSFTAIGHFSSILIGLAFYPMTGERQLPLLNPAKFKAAFRRYRSPEEWAGG